MATTKIKVAYTLFIVSFSIWLTLVSSVLSPEATTENQIQFLSPMLQTLFMSSATASAIACIIIGFDYLGLR